MVRTPGFPGTARDDSGGRISPPAGPAEIRPHGPTPARRQPARGEYAMTSTGLFLHEEILLPALRDREGTVTSSVFCQQVIGGAVLAELLPGDRLGIETDRIINGEVTGKATAQAVQAVQAAVIAAAIVTVIVTTTVSH